MPLVNTLLPAPDPTTRLTCPACQWTGRADETTIEHEQKMFELIAGWRDVTRYVCPVCAAGLRTAIEEVMR